MIDNQTLRMPCMASSSLQLIKTELGGCSFVSCFRNHDTSKWDGFPTSLLGRKLLSLAVPPGRSCSFKTLDALSDSYRIGFGAAEILLDAGAHVVVISSATDNVQSAVERLNSPNVTGRVGDVRDEASFTQLLQSLAPLDHIIFSSVDKIIRGSLADTDLTGAKDLFGVKFWGSIVTAKGAFLEL